QPVLEVPPRRERVDVQAAVGADPELGGHEALLLEPGERLAELDRDGHPTLVIDRMLEVAPEHPTGCRESSPHTRLHLTPPSPTARPEYTPGIVLVKQDFRRPGDGRAGPASARAARRRRSVSRILSPRPGSGGSSHSSGPPVARGIERPTRGKRAGHPYPSGRTGSLLRGLAPGGVYRASALTNGPGDLFPPLSPLAPGAKPGAVSSLWHFPPVPRGRR